MGRVYLETSFASACVTDRTDPASLYRRQASREWWSLQARRHDCFDNDIDKLCDYLETIEETLGDRLVQAHGPPM